MNRKELVDEIKARTGIQKYNIMPVVEALCEIIGDTLVSGEDVTIKNFGKFAVRHRVPRHILDPRGNEIDLPATRNIAFKPSEPLRRRMLGKEN